MTKKKRKNSHTKEEKDKNQTRLGRFQDCGIGKS
jgi:hypothetical protein